MTLPYFADSIGNLPQSGCFQFCQIRLLPCQSGETSGIETIGSQQPTLGTTQITFIYVRGIEQIILDRQPPTNVRLRHRDVVAGNDAPSKQTNKQTMGCRLSNYLSSHVPRVPYSYYLSVFPANEDSLLVSSFPNVSIASCPKYVCNGKDPRGKLWQLWNLSWHPLAST